VGRAQSNANPVQRRHGFPHQGWEIRLKLFLIKSLFYQTGKMSDERAETYRLSVIEREVREGLANAPEPKSTSLAFLRKIANINMSDNKQAGEGRRPIHYVDLLKNGKPDKESQATMDELREVKIPAMLHKANRKHYELDWAAVIGHRQSSWDDYAESLVQDFYKGVLRLIERSAARAALGSAEEDSRTSVATELHRHIGECIWSSTE